MNALELRRRTLGKGVYKKTVEGNPAIAQGSLSRRNPGITMQGWTEQTQYEGNQLFDGVFTVDTVLDTNGETVPYPGRSTTDFIKVKSSTDYTGFTRYLRACYYDAGKVIISYDDDDTVTRQTPEGCEYVRFNFINGSDVMFNEGSTALPYEPYTGGQPSPSPDYPQEIVSAGKYNEDTQKWEYEITIANEQTDPDKNQTVTLTSDRPLTKWDRLEKRNGQWGWVYKSKQIILNGTILNIIGNGTWGNIDDYKTIAFYSYINGTNNSQDIGVDMSRADEALTNQFSYGYVYNNDDANKFTISSGGGYIAFRIDADMLPDWSSEAPSNQPFIDWLDEKEQAGKPVTLLYPTIEETFVPLSESEQELMNELYTFRPTTVLSNDCECEMTLTYKTKKSLEVTD